MRRHERPMSRVLLLAAVALAAHVQSGCSRRNPDSPTPAPAPREYVQRRPIIIGTVSRDADTELRTLKPLASYLARRLSGAGVSGALVAIAPDIPAMADLLRTGQVDLYIDDPFAVIAASRLTNIEFLLQGREAGAGGSHSVIFARARSGLGSLDDLRGRMVAFAEPSRGPWYLLSKASLLQAGLSLSQKPNTTSAVGRREVGYVFSDDDAQTVTWVLRGTVDAGAIDNASFDKLARGRKKFAVLSRTIEVPKQVVSCRRDLRPHLVKALAAALAGMNRTADGRAVLARFDKTRQFDVLDEDGKAAFERIRKLARLIGPEILATASAGETR